MILILFLAPRKDFKRCQSRPKSAKTMLKQAALITFASSAAALQAPGLQVLQRSLHSRLLASSGAEQDFEQERAPPQHDVSRAGP